MATAGGKRTVETVFKAKRRWALAMMAACGLSVSPVRAQTGAAAQAEALFQEGKALLAAGQYAEACPKLEASFRYEPATGTLLALAFCHEQSGRTASAWAEYLDTAARAKAENRPDREKKARERATALAPHLSRLSIRLGSEISATPGLRVTRNGASVESGSFNTLLPVDPGQHRIEVSAPEYRTWTTVVQVQADGDAREVVIPPLEREQTPPPRTQPPTPMASASPIVAPRAPSVASTPVPPTQGESSKSVLPVAGMVVGVVGLVGIGVGTWYGFEARSKNADSEANCDGNQCNPSGTRDRHDALDAARISTIGFGAGIALLGAGTAMILLAPEPQSRTEWQASVAPGAMGMSLRHTF